MRQDEDPRDTPAPASATTGPDGLPLETPVDVPAGDAALGDDHDGPDGPDGHEGGGATRRSTFTGGIWNAAATVLPMASTLALSVVISRELGAEVLGQQSLIAYVGSLMVSVLIFAFTSASVQLLASATGARDDDRLAWLSRWSFGAHLTGGTVAAAVMVSGGLLREDFQLLWFIAAANALVDAVGWAFASRDIARRGWGPTSSRRLVAQAASPVVAIAAVYAGLGIEGVFSAQLAVAVVLLLFLRRIDPGVRRRSTAGVQSPPWRPVLRLSGLFALSAFITQLVGRRVELVFLDYFHDSVSVAMYSVAANVVGLPLMLTATLIGSAMPAIAFRHAQDSTVVLRTLSRSARIVVGVQIVLAAGTVSVGPGLVTAVYGPDFTEAGQLVRWLGLTLLVAPLGSLCAALWTGTGRLRPVLLAGGVAGAVDLVLALVLVPGLAEVGAVIASTAAQAVSAALIIGYTVRSGLRLHLGVRRLVTTALVAAAAGGAAAAAAASVAGWAGEVLALGLFAVVCLAGLRVVGLFDPEDTDWLAATVPAPAARVLRALSPRPRVARAG